MTFTAKVKNLAMLQIMVTSFQMLLGEKFSQLTFSRLTVETCQFLRLTDNLSAVLRLTAKAIETRSLVSLSYRSIIMVVSLHSEETAIICLIGLLKIHDTTP